MLQSDPPTYPSPGVYRTGKRPELWWQLKPLNSYGTNLLAPSGEAVIQLFEALVEPLVPDATRSGGTHVTLWRRSGPDAQFRTGGYSVRSGARGAVYRWSPDRPSILEVATPSGGRYSLDTESGISTAH